MRAVLWLAGRFTVVGGREARVRVALNLVGVSVGVLLVLLTLTALPALSGRDHRGAWHATTSGSAPTAPDHALWLAAHDHFLGQDLFVVRVAALGPRPPIPPGLDRLPRPGEVVASPALRDLLATTARDALGDRFPGPVSAELGQDGLAYPDELVAVIGQTPDELRRAGASEVSGIAATAPGTLDNAALRVILTIGAMGLLLPVVVFIASTARISAHRREQRFSALRLIGAGRGQVALVAAAETAAGAAVGAVLGWAGYLLARPLVATTVTFDGARFVPDDVRAPAAAQLLVVVAAPLLCAAATVVALRRAQVSPLGVQRRARRRRPGWWRLLPVALGAAGLVLIAATDLTDTTRSSVATAQVLIGGTFGALLLGLVVAGPLLCTLVARLLGTRSRRLPALMAAGRIAADPFATFRAISGVAIAALVTAMFAGSAAGVRANLDHADPDALRSNAVEIVLGGEPDATLLAAVRRADGVRDAVVVRKDPRVPGTIAVSCPALAAAVNITCPDAPSPNGRVPVGLRGVTHLAPPDAKLLPHAIYVATDGAPLTAERVRTLVSATAPSAIVSTGQDLVELDRRQLTELETGLRLAMLFVLLVAAASLTVGVAAGLVARRRPFALLHATGVHLGELRRMVLLETALPLIITTICGLLLGVGASAAISSASGQHWTGPGPGFLATAGAGLLITLAVSAAAMPLVKTITAHDAVRFE